MKTDKFNTVIRVATVFLSDKMLLQLYLSTMDMGTASDDTFGPLADQLSNLLLDACNKYFYYRQIKKIVYRDDSKVFPREGHRLY